MSHRGAVQTLCRDCGRRPKCSLIPRAQAPERSIDRASRTLVARESAMKGDREAFRIEVPITQGDPGHRTQRWAVAGGAVDQSRRCPLTWKLALWPGTECHRRHGFPRYQL